MHSFPWNIDSGCARGLVTGSVFFSPGMMKVLSSVRKPTLLIRPCNPICSDTLLVKPMFAAEICILMPDVRPSCQCQGDAAEELFPFADWHPRVVDWNLLSGGGGKGGKELPCP